MSAETIHEAFELDLNKADTAEDAFKILCAYYSALVELVQPESQDKDRMKKIRLMTPKLGNAITVYHAYVKLEPKKTLGQKVKEWFRRQQWKR
jgi:hypothetical protein